MEDIRRAIKYQLLTNKQKFAEKIVELQYSLSSDFYNFNAPDSRELSVRDAGYHLPFLAEAIVSKEPDIFTDYVSWVKTLFDSLNFPDEVISDTLKCTKQVLKTELGDEMALILDEYIEAGIKQISRPSQEVGSYLEGTDQIGLIAKQYNEALLSGNKHKASEIVFKAIQDGIEIKDIYLDVFQKSQYEIGRLWLSNQISVAKEHYCSAATQMIMSQLYPYIFSSSRNGKKFIGACVGGELHEIGIRMVADFFEMDGWDTYYLGANVPASNIVQSIEENNADIVGLSAAMPFHIDLLRETILTIRENVSNQNLKILIGGNALRNLPEIEMLNADGYATDANKAIQLANKLIA